MQEVYILSGARTPMGRLLGALASFPATSLGGIAIKEAVKRAGISPSDVDEVIMGCVLQAGVGQGPARIAAIKGGIPPEVPSFTVNKVCGSALKAIILGVQAIKVGDADCIVAGGMESMTNAPHMSFLRLGTKFGDIKFIDHMIYDGLWCSFNNQHMGELAEYTAEKAGITREMMDEFAYNSHMKAV
ncbi:MAG: beta-ketoacyl synthase N-terminal-like domain-containing protein, partial [candidate division WOR-3 bacterium]